MRVSRNSTSTVSGLETGTSCLLQFQGLSLNPFRRVGADAKEKGLTSLDLSINLIGSQPYQSGALVSCADDPTEIIIRVGVSFTSAGQACADAELEVGTVTFETIHERAREALSH